MTHEEMLTILRSMVDADGLHHDDFMGLRISQRLAISEMLTEVERLAKENAAIRHTIGALYPWIQGIVGVDDNVPWGEVKRVALQVVEKLPPEVRALLGMEADDGAS